MKELDLNIFPKTSKQEWKLLAAKQLKGGDPDEVLAWTNAAGISLEAYYNEEDTEKLTYLKNFFENITPHRWKLYEEVVVKDTKEANENILKALEGGCDGVIVNINSAERIEEVLNNVMRDICDIGLRSDVEMDTVQGIKMMLFPNGNCKIISETRNPVLQIKEALDSQKYPYIYRHSLPDFFLEIATLRAMKYLFQEIGIAPHIHSHVPRHPSDEHQWFLNTTAGLASILGGTNSIDFTTAIGDPRISRNTGNLIREESGIYEYTDQCGGSYYVERLTHKIIEKVKELEK